MAEHYCQIVQEDNTVCGAPATRFVTTTFGHPLYPDMVWSRQYWYCDQHLKEVAESPVEYVIDGRPIVAEVLKEEF
jgi:hypothetical protein